MRKSGLCDKFYIVAEAFSLKYHIFANQPIYAARTQIKNT